MVGLFFIALMLGVWLLVAAIVEDDLFCGIDLSEADLILGDGYGQWICGVAGGIFFLIGVIGLVV
jgi:hypothetical protein